MGSQYRDTGSGTANFAAKRIYSINSMAVWADNIKFVKDIIDSKFNKIDQAVAEVTESLETLKTDCKNGPAKEHFTFALRSLELVQPAEIEQLLETVLGDLHEKERDALEHQAAEKLQQRVETLDKSKQMKTQLNI